MRVLQGKAGADQHQLLVELDGRDVPQGSTVELHWCVRQICFRVLLLMLPGAFPCARNVGCTAAAHSVTYLLGCADGMLPCRPSYYCLAQILLPCCLILCCPPCFTLCRRGVYRSAPHLWQHPAEVVPAGSHRNERSGAMVSAMQPSGNGRYSLTLTVPAALVPLTLACVVHVAPPEGAKDTAGRPVRPHFVTPLRGRHFSALIGCSPGSAEQQGVTLLPSPAAGQQAAAAGTAARPSVLEFGGGAAAAAAQKHSVNFAVRCRGADRVCLVLLRPQAAAAGQQQQGGQQQEWGMVELVLDPVLNRTGELWHIAGG